MNGSNNPVRWDIVILTSLAILGIVICSVFTDAERFATAATGIGVIVSTVIVGLLNRKAIEETKEEVKANTVITEQTASLTERTADAVNDLKKSGT